MDTTTDRFRSKKPGLETVKNKPELFDAGLPSSVEEAALVMYALSFGPLSKSDLARALKQVGMTMRDGSAITIQKLTPCMQRLRDRGQITSMGSDPPVCRPEARTTTIEAARKKGWLHRFAAALQRAVPGQVGAETWEYKWGRRRFVSFSHACRDVFLALELDDQDQIKRLAGLCSQDERIGSIVKVLVIVCMDPFQPQYVERLLPQYRDLLLYEGLHQEVMLLKLNHPVFAYARDWLVHNHPQLNKTLLERCVTHVVERDLLAGDFLAARDLLEHFADLNIWIIRGMFELLSGRKDEARFAYEQALRQVGKSKTAQIEYLLSFPATLHTLLLIQSDQTPTDHQQVRNWMTWLNASRIYSGYRDTYAFLAELLAWHEGYDIAARLKSEARFFPTTNVPALIRASSYVTQLLSWFYTSQTKAMKNRKHAILSELESFLHECSTGGANWVGMQIVRLLSRLGQTLPAYRDQAEAFFRDTPAKDLSELWPIKEIWESRIDALEQLLHEAQDAETRPTNASRRLGWKLREWKHAGRIEVIPVEQKRTKTGGWTKGREIGVYRLAQLNPQEIDYLTDQDRAALVNITGRREYYDMVYRLDTGLALRALTGHPNVFWEDHPHLPVEIVQGTPEVCIVPKAHHLCIRMIPYPEVDVGANFASIITKESPTRVRVVVFEPKHIRMAEILGPDGVSVPKDHSESVLNRLQGLSKHVAIQSDVALATEGAEVVEPDSQPRLRLQRLDQGLRAEMVVAPLGNQSQRAFTPGVGNPHLVEFIGGKPLQTHRVLQDEADRAAAALEAIGLDDEKGDYLWILDDPEMALGLLERLQEVNEQTLRVEWPKGDPITVRSLSPQQLRLSIHSAQDWFEIEGEIRVDENLMIRMQALLEEIENGDKRFIALGKDQYVALTKQLRKQLQWLATGGQFTGKGNRLRIHPLAAISLEKWKNEIGEFQADATFDAHIDRFRRVESYQPMVPSTLQTQLRPYQRDGFIWLARLAEWGVGACLAADMGLGKTIEALALILHRASQGPTLVAAPTSVCANWVFEAQRFAPTLRPIRFGIGDLGRRNDVLKALGPFDLLICSYTLLQQEAEAIKDVKFATIVLDEAQAIKNAATKRSSAAMNLNGGFRMICTGTPIENRLSELWNLFRFINPGLLGSEERFRERFVRPIEGERDPGANHVLKAIVQPFILRRTKAQVLEDLPPRTEVMRLVELSPEERALHESLRQRALERLEGTREMDRGQAHIQVLAELMKLRRCCCNPRLVVPNCGLTGSKLEAFAELVDELIDNQHKALVFSQFVDHLTLLREYLDAKGIRYQYLDGQTPAKTRQRRIDAFQNGEGDLFLISLKAGGLGLNLTAADYVIHMDPWWNPAVEDQASDRAHRIGQTRPVTVYRLVAADTIEEKIVQLHHAKRDLADSLLEGTDTAHTLTADELIDLLRNR